MASDQVEWIDPQLGIKIQFCPNTLALVHEERQRHLVLLKFSSCKEPESTVQCVIEGLVEATTPDNYRCACIEKISDVCQLISADGSQRFGTNAYPVAKYCYLSEADAMINVFSVFLTQGNIALTVQFCTSKSLPSTLPSFVHELVRTTKFVAPQQTSSYLFCCEPRLGVGFRVPLGFSLSKESHNHRNVFAKLFCCTSSTTIVGFHIEMSPVLDWEQIFDDMIGHCSARLGFVRPSVTVDGREQPRKGSIVMRTCNMDMPTNNVRFGWNGSDAESSKRIQAHCCYHEVAMEDMSLGSSYLGVYCLPIGSSECIVMAYLCPRSHDKQHFIHFCQGVTNSVSLGNHYGQETSLSYCCMRGLYKFHLNIETEFSVSENPFSDPLCVLCKVPCSTNISIRIVPRVESNDLESQLLDWIQRLGGFPRIRTVVRRALTSLEGSLVAMTHEHHFNCSFDSQEESKEFERNPLVAPESDDDAPPPDSLMVGSVLLSWGQECFVLRGDTRQHDEDKLLATLLEVAERMVPFH